MPDVDALLAAVCAAPDDMAPRRAFADAVRSADSDRAKLIDVQLDNRERRRRGEDVDPSGARSLIILNGERWAGALAKQVSSFEYWGGFVEEIRVKAPKLFASWSTLVRLAPIRHLRVEGDSTVIGELATLPLLSQLRSLDVSFCRLKDADVTKLVASTRLRGLRMLVLSHNPDISMDALRAVARAELPELKYVGLDGTNAALFDEWYDQGVLYDVKTTVVYDTLLEEFGSLPWLKRVDAPSCDVI
ncbi:MAG: hypothetical protein JST54_22495 [Deltaproteobacteria bacterium]|nr:hypothetical protein [Deltaproteobacteria bacterium]